MRIKAEDFLRSGDTRFRPVPGLPPINLCSLEGRIMPMGYKVVTEDMKSLGLRRNPNILEFRLGEWYTLKEDDVLSGSSDWGGIWLSRTYSGGRSLQRYMEKKDRTARIFKAAIEDILFYNSYRMKTNGILLYEEL